jgi:hypothetical protein
VPKATTSEPRRRRLRPSALLTPFRKAATGIGRAIGRTPWLRRRYARYILRSIKKQRAKDRPLPENLLRLERQVRGLPPRKQAEVIEQLLETSATFRPEAAGRAMRRATAKQERRSGKGPGVRPGLLPGQRRRA